MKKNKKPVTRFMDMHSGGELKTAYTHIYIDGSLETAVKTFQEAFGIDPDNQTCDCCGKDFFYDEYENIEEATAYERECEWNDQGYDLKTAKISVDEYVDESSIIWITE
jgi:hypothetical protein